MIEPAASDKDQILDWRQRRLHKTRDLLCVVTDKSWLRPKRLRNKRALLPRVNTAVEKSRREGEPRGWAQIILVINLRALEQSPRRTDKSVLVWIVDLPFVIVTENEFVVPPVSWLPINVRTN